MRRFVSELEPVSTTTYGSDANQVSRVRTAAARSGLRFDDRKDVARVFVAAAIVAGCHVVFGDQDRASLNRCSRSR